MSQLTKSRIVSFRYRFTGPTTTVVRQGQGQGARTGMDCGQLVATDRVPVAVQAATGIIYANNIIRHYIILNRH